MNYRIVRLTFIGRITLIVFVLSLCIGIPTYQYVMNPVRVLNRAFKTMDIDKLRWAIDHGVDVDTFVQNLRPIALAFNNGRHDFMETLANAGATLDLNSAHDISFAGRVAASGDSLALSVLARHGANLMTKADTLNRSIASHIVAEGKSHLLPIIAEHGDINALDGNLEAPLHYAGNHTDPSMVEYMISRGANPNVTDGNGNTPLHLITDMATVAVLHKNGASLDTMNTCGVPPLAYHLAHGNRESYLYLVNSGASLDWQDADGYNALHYAYLAKSATLANLVQTHFRERHPEQYDRFMADAAKTALGAAVTYLVSRRAAQVAMERAFKYFLKRKGLRMVGRSIVPIAGLIYTIFTLRRTIREAKALYQQWQDEQREAKRLERELSELREALWDRHTACLSP